MNRVRLAMIGAGAIARTHLDRIRSNHRLELVGLADPAPDTQNLADSWGVPGFSDHHQLLDTLKPQGVIIATPNQLHLPIALDCLHRGVAIMVEKPVTDGLRDARQLVQAQVRSGVPVLVGHHRRHNPIIRRARSMVESGRLGRLVSAHVQATFLKPDSYFDTAWRRQKGGGPILINLIHDIDMLRFLMGEVTSVQAMASHAVRGFEVEDTAAAMLGFANGALATLLLSDTVTSPWCWDFCAGEQAVYPRQATQSHFIGGTHGAVSLPDLTFWNYRGERSWHAEMTREQVVVHLEDPYASQLQHFHDVILGKVQPVCGALDGLRTLQATLAVQEAAATGSRVLLQE